MKIKFYKENIPVAIILCVVIVIIFPLLATFIAPGVAEAVIPELGECDITYKGEFHPCMTWGEAYRINFNFALITGLIATIAFLFFCPYGEEEDSETFK